MELYIDNRQNQIDIDDKTEELLKKIAVVCLDIEDYGLDWEISVSFVTNDEIRELNREYRGKDEPTDVLSFPFEDEFRIGEKMLGDIVISTEKVLQQAKDLGHSLQREISYLAVHSMFHLMGYDHLDAEERKEMRLKEKRAMKELGIFKDQEVEP
ncbi:rRNA maturation RNase YbeY [Gudongella oleilytica]|jgi:probable rRNA maturation factor|uniref:rRNA maturation RNase YbeY n=1 Tax=Gudongella oleilytica TaxID=1582259 RepID=UPI002A35DE1D|nr:rRNA maturation RNase YbeY [Gudongella oleilytica]MDY0255628.1 rRNA maturation RNase YbeY [Gudongella oleilytica]HMM69100.1 rRNA maturation RNase YbeY [Gudongella oleilytica]